MSSGAVHSVLTPSGAIVAFAPNRAQSALAGVIERRRAAGARIVLIVSGRGLGVTNPAAAGGSWGGQEVMSRARNVRSETAMAMAP